MIKKLMLLITILLIVFNSFSQTVTDSIKIPLSTSKLIVQDLLEGDKCRSNYPILESNIRIMESQLKLKDDMLGEKDSQIKWYQSKILNKDAEIGIYEDEYDKLARKYKNLKVNDRFKMGIGATVIVGLMYMLIKH